MSIERVAGLVICLICWGWALTGPVFGWRDYESLPIVIHGALWLIFYLLIISGSWGFWLALKKEN